MLRKKNKFQTFSRLVTKRSFKCLLGKENTKITVILAAGEMAQSVKGLLCRHEDLNSIPRTYIKKLVWWRVLIIPALGRRRQASPGASSQPSLLSEFQGTERPCL